MISDAVNVQLIPRLMRLNGFDSDGLKLDHSPAGDMDIQVLASFLQSVGDKITWLPADETWLRQVANLPERSEEEIEEAKEEAQARAMEIMQRGPAANDTEQPAPGQKQPTKQAQAEDEEEAEEDQRGDDMSVKAVVDWYKSERPDDVKRRRYYRKYQRELQGVFAKLGRRIKKEMRQ
jgi:ribosomal protein L12E/L44/L45/RPP1/RPP2